MSIYDDKKYIEPFKGMIGGTIGSLASSMVSHSIDTIIANSIHKNTSFIKSARIIVQLGYLNLLRGYGSVACNILPSRSGWLFTYYMCQNLIQGKNDQVTISNKFISAGGAGIVLSLILCPAEVIKTKKQLNIYQKKAFFENNIGYYYKGFLPLTGRVLPAAISVTAGADYVREKFFKNYATNSLVVFNTTTFLAAFSQIFSVPYETVRVKVVASSGNTRVWDILKNQVKDHGFKGLYKGFFARTTMFSIQTGVTLLCAEYARSLSIKK